MPASVPARVWGGRYSPYRQSNRCLKKYEHLPFDPSFIGTDFSAVRAGCHTEHQQP